MAEWKKVLVSGSNIEVNQITGSGDADIQGTLSIEGIADVSASIAAAGTAINAGDGLLKNGGTLSVDSASLATDMAGDFITATDGTLNLATSVGTLGTNKFTGSFSGSFTGDGSGLTGVVSTDATKAQTVETIATTDTEPYFLTFVDSNNGTADAEIVYTTDGIKVTPETNAITAGIVSANSFSGSFSGSFEGDGSGLTGVAPTAGDGIFVNGTTVSVDSGSLIQTATDDTAYNVLFNNSTTPFVIDNTTSHFQYNPGTNVLAVSGAIKIGWTSGVANPEITFDIRNTSIAKAASFEHPTGTAADIQLDGNRDMLFRQNPNGSFGHGKDFKFQSSGSDTTTVVDRFTIDGNGGGITIRDVASADAAERTALVVDGTGNVQSLELGDAVTTHSGSLTVAQADGFYLTDNSSTDSDYNVIFSTDAPGNYIGAQGDGDSFTYNPGSNTLTVGTLVGDVTGTASSASYVSAAKVDGTVASATNAESASHVAAAFDTVSVTNATITLTDMAGNTSSGTVNNVSNATTAVNATNATNATNISVDQSSEDTNFNITFTESTTGYASLFVDNNGKLTYNPNTDVLTVGSTLSVGGTATVGSNLTVTGDLIVNGTTTTLNTTNLEVEDAFILLRSGSSTVGSSGIIFGGSEGELNSGSALVWAAGYNSNDGRLAITTGSASTITGDPDITYYLAGVYEGTATGAAEAQADHPGNIRIDNNEIFIYA